MAALSLPDCSSDFQLPYSVGEYEHLFELVAGHFVPPEYSESASLITFEKLMSLCSEKMSPPPIETHADVSFLNSENILKKFCDSHGSFPANSSVKGISVNEHVQQSSIAANSSVKGISVNEHVQQSSIAAKSSIKAMSLNEHVQHVCSKNKYTTSSGNHLIDPSASFDLITAET